MGNYRECLTRNDKLKLSYVGRRKEIQNYLRIISDASKRVMNMKLMVSTLLLSKIRLQ